MLVETIRKQLYNYFVSCGPKENVKTAYFPKVSQIMGTELLNITPDRLYRPEVYVTFDFSYQFTDPRQEVPTKPAVSDDTIKRSAQDMAKYFSYYFEYPLSKGTAEKEYQRTELAKTFSKVRKGEFSTKEYVQFINFIINFFLTSVSVSRSLKEIGSASVDLRDVNFIGQEANSLLFNRMEGIFDQLFVPNVYMRIWARGRIYNEWYFPIFSGYTVRTTSSSNQGFNSLTVYSKDVLELARLSQEMINPALIQVEQSRRQNINIFAKPLYGIDHFDIFFKMFHGGLLRWDPNAGTFAGIEDILENGTKQRPQNTPSSSYWFQSLERFKLSSDIPNFKDQLVTPFDVAERRGIHKENFSLDKAVEYTLGKNANNNRSKDIYTVAWGHSMTPYRQFGTQGVKTTMSEYDSRLAILRKSAETVYYELYTDAWGNVQYHPMRLANDYLTYDIISADLGRHEDIFPYVNIVQPEEVFQSSQSIDVENLITECRVRGEPAIEGVDSNQIFSQTNLVGLYRSVDLQKRFGRRFKEYVNTLFNFNPDIPIGTSGKKVPFLKLAAASLLNYLNAELHTYDAALVFRPELELGRPIMVFPDRQVFYLQSIEHSIQIGGQATTSISCNFGREFGDPPPDLMNFMIMSQKVYKLNKVILEADIKEFGNNVTPLAEAGKWLEQEKYIENKREKNKSEVTDFTKSGSISNDVQGARSVYEQDRKRQDLIDKLAVLDDIETEVEF